MVAVLAHVGEREDSDRPLVCALVRCGVRAPHELIDCEEGNGDRQNTYDHLVEPLSGRVGDRRGSINVSLSLETLRRDFKKPTECQDQREADDEDPEQISDRGVAKSERRKKDVAHLEQKPRGNDVPHRDAEHVPTLELGEETGAFSGHGRDSG
ncbi:MAG: hypothetical protein MJB57_10030 [Gemmatimonadetes bacterium]|nr:hypothetical protein [Gemmatimonadota bacterium]